MKRLIFLLILVATTAHGAIPTYQAGVAQTSTSATAITSAELAGLSLAADDIMIAMIHTSNQTAGAIANTLGDAEWQAATWQQVGSSPQGTGTAASAGSLAIAAFWMRFDATMTLGNITFADSGDHQILAVLSFRGCKTTGSPLGADSAGQINTGSSVDAIIPQISFTEGGVLVVTILGGARDIGSQTVTNLLNPNSAFDFAPPGGFIISGTAGTGGGICMLHADMTTPGTIPNTTTKIGDWNNSATLNRAAIVFTLKDPTPATNTTGFFLLMP